MLLVLLGPITKMSMLQVCEECVTAKYFQFHGNNSEKEQIEESDKGEATGAQGGQDLLSHSPRVHPHLDSLQRVSCHEGHPWTRSK